MSTERPFAPPADPEDVAPDDEFPSDRELDFSDQLRRRFDDGPEDWDEADDDLYEDEWDDDLTDDRDLSDDEY